MSRLTIHQASVLGKATVESLAELYTEIEEHQTIFDKEAIVDKAMCFIGKKNICGKDYEFGFIVRLKDDTNE